jgi:cell division protein YceG involved in septum cleavage
MTLLRNSFFILVIVAILTGLYLFKSVPLTLVPAQEFTISKGDTILSLQKKLNIPLHPLIFRLYIRLYQKDFVLKAGSYHLENEKSLESLFSETLKNPQSEDIAITILPGWNIFDIDKAFSEQSIIRRGELIEYSRSIPLNIRNDYPFLKNSPSLE